MGTGFFWAPRGAAGFGIPDGPTGDPAFRVRPSVKGVRDIGAGLRILVVPVGGTTHLLDWVVPAA
ncbi:hypothetical protein Afil01_35500 [Actinorhabdospora filicis]|uniref:Uncharacterized protein n=2 Tax=Actinorhabdospora filicis TaxID=1785913 RepID=A0A9W6WA76_9ACTN|nr:hypothetical protein Afil01_35500 [Actinorhabdospora filicis]